VVVAAPATIDPASAEAVTTAPKATLNKSTVEL
jgi:hypothetical protein